MATRIYIPRETTASSLGADLLIDAITTEAKYRNLAIEIVRNGSRGACFLEPLVEIETANGRVGYGPVQVEDVPDLFDADFLKGGKHKLALGNVEELPWFKQQERLTFARCGLIDATSVAEYKKLGGYVGLQSALKMSGADIVKAVLDSGLRGRGGAAFPTGIKWKTVHDAQGPQKYIVCNADEGDSGTFADRMIMEGDPLSLVEGMTIAGIAVGATMGYIYLRSEYPLTQVIMNEAIANARAAGYLGNNVAGSGKKFELEVRMGAGAYICGEETSLLESLEGKRGQIRFKPPLPALKGLFGKPTIVNNVITLATVPVILEKGAKHYAGFGRGRSLGTLPFQIGGNIKRGGLVEKAFGLTLRQLIDDFGGGTATGKPVRAVQVGGPLGAYFPDALLDTPLDYEDFAKAGGMVGHGGVVVFDTSVNMAKMARFSMEFCSAESCGKCTPCRIGSVRGMETIDRIVAASNDGERNKQHIILKDLCETMESASLCAMGGLTPMPVMSAVKHFKGDFQ
ncbi:MAG TPA: NADH-ubiquinone oxidoreductase-F iron-sulfur binding region domain-containing protein [Candidatus Acidoferrum sp.]|nr:NADH-ubiquinone oxidoreductase-F iron-sulfur binding region domain-containing protein [Candidatus Acidoferrum sp.]